MCFPDENYDFDALSNSEHYLYAHKDMIRSLVDEGLSKDVESATARVTMRVNQTCKNILLNTAVFKDDEIGKKAFIKFLNACNIV